MIRQVARRGVQAALQPFGLELRRCHKQMMPPVPNLPDGDRSTSMSCAIIGTPQGGFSGPGKCTPAMYFPKFHYGLTKQGVAVSYFKSIADFARDHDGATPTIAVLVYNEELGTDFDLLDRFEAALPPHVLVANSARIGRIIGNKRLTNKHLDARGIRVPRIIAQAEGVPIFSNEICGTSRPTRIIHTPEPGRYNTAYIDTRQAVGEAEYHVTVRALTVGGTCMSAYVRLRPTSANDASVHAKDTPLDPSLINHFQRELVQPRLPEIGALCRRVADALGLGFYVHDLLLCRDTGQIYLCETGFKFDDFSFRNHLWPISADLPSIEDHFSMSMATRAARVLMTEISRSRPQLVG